MRKLPTGEISLAEAAAVAGYSASTINRAIKQGQIKTIQRGRYVNIIAPSLTEWQKSRNELDVSEAANAVRA
jgi:hypothetical protein